VSAPNCAKGSIKAWEPGVVAHASNPRGIPEGQKRERREREREKEKKKEEEEEEEDREIKRKEKNRIARAKPGVVAHTYNPSTREAESGGS
jgi:septal ring factor EnvC (AmiA/AmiB activator)